VESTLKLLYDELRQFTRASEQNCQTVSARIAAEVDRICQESQRIQASGQVDTWAINLARHRFQQCLKYYRLGARQGRVELHSTLSAVIYRYISPAKGQASYQARLTLIEDFLQGFYMEALNVFRRENQTAEDYQPRTLLDVAEYMAFAERYAKRRIPLPYRRSQQLIILRVQTFSQQQPQEAFVDLEQAAEGGTMEGEDARGSASMQQVREQMVAQDAEPAEDSLRQKVVQELLAYLEERQQHDCVNYFTLRLQDMSAGEIESVLGLTPRERDYLQQRFKYHLIRFSMSHQWELVHEWLEADLGNNLGLMPQQWQSFQDKLNPRQTQLLRLKQDQVSDASIAQSLGCTVAQMNRQWSKLLEQAWDLRNRANAAAGMVLPAEVESVEPTPAEELSGSKVCK
jgi:hypothetical protein